MKTSLDPRHQRRRRAVENLFSWSFQPTEVQDELTSAIIKNKEKIDKIIANSAPEWPIAQINKIDLAVLRLAVYELIISRSEPEKVVIDEAVELGKAYGSEKSSAFINGVLGTVFKNEGLSQNDQKPKKSAK